MTEKQQMQHDAEQLVCDADDAYKRVLEFEPTREPLARFILDDTVRVYALTLGRLTFGARLEMASRLIRVNLLTEALLAPLQ